MTDASIQQQLRRAIDRGDADQVRALIAEGADVNCRGNDPDGETPLVRAIAANQLSVVRVLIEAGADVNGAERLNGWTPLMSPHVALSDDQRQLTDEQRRWARDLANAFGTQDSCVKPNDSAPRAPGDNVGITTFWATQLLRRSSCAEDFRNRDRPDFWLYLSGYGFLLGLFVFTLIAVGGIPPTALLAGTGLFVFFCYMAWRRATPICPNCKQNIRICTAVHCHVCGKALSGRRCAECKVDHSWTSFVIPYNKSGNYRAISYCPNCGTWLDSKIRRWRASRV